MLKKLILENWKSFRYAELPIDPLTVLIGTNASGKSNALEALDFLRRITQGETVRTALLGNTGLPAIRGGIEWATIKPENQFTLKALIQGNTQYVDYLYSITIETNPKVRIYSESLKHIEQALESDKNLEPLVLFQTDVTYDSDSTVTVQVKKQNKNELSAALPTSDETLLLVADRTNSILSRSSFISNFDEKVFTGNQLTLEALSNVFILDPIPSSMRSYSTLSDALQNNGSNIAGVLAGLSENNKTYIESVISTYISHLPERDIQRVWAEPVGRLQSDAMLYCEEAWVPGEEPTVIDARGMSDGTLRFLAILTALLTRPEGSQLVIEEVDNGLHPSRADLLLKMLREIGEQRQIDVLVTTHNPALLNALEPEMLPFVIVAHRDAQTGESKLTPLEDLENLPKLMASGPLGKLAEQGSIERSLSGA